MGEQIEFSYTRLNC